jgi:hypothetical protein
MKYDRLEQLPCWKAAMDLALRVCTITRVDTGGDGEEPKAISEEPAA